MLVTTWLGALKTTSQGLCRLLRPKWLLLYNKQTSWIRNALLWDLIQWEDSLCPSHMGRHAQYVKRGRCGWNLSITARIWVDGTTFSGFLLTKVDSLCLPAQWQWVAFRKVSLSISVTFRQALLYARSLAKSFSAPEDDRWPWKRNWYLIL